MYAIPNKNRLVQATPRLGSSSVCIWRSYYSASDFDRLQRLRNEFNKAKSNDTSGKWKSNASAGNPTNPSISKRPVIGGHARNNLKSAHSAIPTFKPFFEQASPTATIETAHAVPTKLEQKPKEDSSSKVDSPKPALGSARFFFMGRGQPTKQTELPSVAWASKNNTAQDSPPATGSTGTAKNQPASDLGASKTANAVGSADLKGRSSELSRMVQEYGRRHNPADKKNAPKKLEQQSPTQQDRKQPDIKHAKQGDAPKKPVEHKHRTSAAPRRPGQRIENADQDDENQMKRRRRKFKLPKKGLEVVLPITITVDGLAKLLDVPNDHMLRKMANIGMDKLANNYLLTNEEAAEIALEYEVVPIIPENSGPELLPQPIPEDMSVHPYRPPVVTIMGHVDHGKTTLLDTLRNSTITASEAGGITQHIGAFSVELKDGHHITFLDTPGHAAFSAMRARGANATDIVVLVVAADDGVMPQTKEAIQHALDADVPIIVAVNKCDKPGVDPSRILEELLKYGIQTEEMGGDIQSVNISALKGTGVDELAENIATLAEVMDLRAEVDIPTHATVIESQVEKGRGNVASVLVKRGTLRVGDIIVAGTAWCKVRSMSDDSGNPVKSATPASAVRVMGWKEIPQAGDMVLQAASESQAKDVVANRIDKRKNRDKLQTIGAMNEQRRETNERESSERAEEKAYKKAVWEFHNGLRNTHPDPLPKKGAHSGEVAGGTTEEIQIQIVPVVIKGDVSGTVEAVAGALKQLPDKKIRVNVISTGVGPVTESDVTMAGSGSQGVVIAFNVKADKKTLNAAKREGVEVMPFRVIYRLLEDVEKLLTSRLEPIRIEEIQGEAVVQEVFEVTLKGNKIAKIAGSRVTVGSVTKGAKSRVLRGDKELFTGDISSLKNIKHDISEATKGQEFGICFAGFEDIKEGDIIHSLRYKDIPQKLT
ncbi:translation initiation factor IF-2 [Kickxella alabastrina]|uniref:Translation initiation factor IF-2 n=1 Tax=Kickxella alabastrina TaxID=61397 RepID=A0ACC1IDM8_9FUNG|nr:translation initiation factor IF-2 [Kickxella alabastrina]